MPRGYTEHFGLTLPPFTTAPDPRFAYGTRAHELALLRIHDAVDQRLGLSLLSGEIGAGKSTIAHLLLSAWAEAPDEYVTAYISNPSLRTTGQFLRLVAESFGLETSRYQHSNETAIRSLLLDSHEANKTVVLLLDEAQTISAPNMGTLQHLSNEQTPQAKLLQIVLLSQPNFAKKLTYFPALDSRIARRGTLDALIFQDALDMLRHRVAVAGGDFDTLFPADTHRAIHNATAGNPRKLCVLCDNILFHTFARREKAVTTESLEAALADTKYGAIQMNDTEPMTLPPRGRGGLGNALKNPHKRLQEVISETALANKAEAEAETESEANPQTHIPTNVGTNVATNIPTLQRGNNPTNVDTHNTTGERGNVSANGGTKKPKRGSVAPEAASAVAAAVEARIRPKEEKAAQSRLSVDLPDELLNEVKMYCMRRRTTVRAVVEALLEELVAGQK